MSVYNDIEEAYRQELNSLSSYAKRHLFNRDLFLDAVHEAFTKTIEYRMANPEAQISSFIIERELARVCRRMNRFSKESLPIPVEHEQEDS